MTSYLRIAVLTFGLMSLCAAHAFADPNSEDISAVEDAVTDLYAVISGPVGQARDWDRFRSMYLPNAVMGAVGSGPEGEGRATTFGPEQYIERSGDWPVENGFEEVPTRTEITLYGELAYIKFAYIATNGATGETLFTGVNFITMFKVEGEWKIASILWRQSDGNWPVERAFD
jgi:hypothetical protein